MTIKSVLVKDYMSGRLVTFTPQTDVLDVIEELVQHRISGAPIVDERGRLIGMISEFDCLQVVLTSGYHREPGGPVEQLMTTDVETVDANMNIIDLAELFIATRFRRFPVVTDNRLVGQISRRDVLRALCEISRE